MLDIEHLERHLRESDPTVQVFSTTKKWLRAVIDEMKGYRKRIADLEAENAALRAGVTTTTTTTIIRNGGRKTVNDTDFPTEEFDEAMGFMDKAFASVDKMFTKLGRKK